ncbi:allatostatin receptor-like [Tropilaelaps mercedesae]|uniref:Allatostatin receptor-like n=1 Tax=Tropilaelaps mercedesae TaxID=418985 RepID=A0A1V9XKA6_9ACAR|nr:allatostatin receptor-like [Tropilaelaps mercedesae]
MVSAVRGSFPGYWPFGDIWCRTVQYFINVCAYASIYTLVLMSLDRYLAVVHPITSMQLRVERNSLIACSLLWVIIVIVCIPVAFIHETAFSNGSIVACVTNVTGGKSEIAVLEYFRFAFCKLTQQVILFLKSMQMIDVSSNMTLLVLQVCAQILAYTNSCMNPILYAFLSENFRKAFRKLILCGAREAPLGQLAGHQHSVNNHHPRGSTVVTTANGHKNGGGTTTVTADNGQLISDIL